MWVGWGSKATVTSFNYCASDFYEIPQLLPVAGVEP